MKRILEILRRKSRSDTPAWQSFRYETEDETDTLATALTALNEQPALRDEDGNPAGKIFWECSCLQKKCGACAMVINGRPSLACNAKLADYPRKIRVEPLRKFPVVADLAADRAVMYRNLTDLRIWLEETPEMREEAEDLTYESSRCLQCGCCLEVCPNFDPDGIFTGLSSAVLFTRLLAETPSSRRKELAASYRRRFYNGCGKSLACRNICPAGIDVDHLLVNANAIAVWKRWFRR